MNIVIMAPVYPPEVTESAFWLERLAAGLMARHDVRVVAYSHIRESCQIPVTIFIQKRLAVWRRLWFAIVVLWKESARADVLIAGASVASSLPATIVGLLRRKPVILWMPEDEVWERAIQLTLTTQSRAVFLSQTPSSRQLRRIRRFQRWITHWVDRIVTPSQAFADLVAQTLSLERAKFFINPTPPPMEEQLPFSISRLKNHLLLTGKPNGSQAMKTFVRAVAMVRESVPDLSISVMGFEPISASGLGEFAEWYGQVSRAEASFLRRRASVICLMAESEELPIEYFLAAQAKTPVVSVCHAVASELGNRFGQVVDLDDADEMAMAIRRALDIPGVISAPPTAEEFLANWESVLKRVRGTV